MTVKEKNAISKYDNFENKNEHVAILDIQILVDNEYWRTFAKADSLTYRMFYEFVVEKWYAFDVRVVDEENYRDVWEYTERNKEEK